MPEPVPARCVLGVVVGSCALALLGTACGGESSSTDSASAATRPAAGEPLSVVAEDIDFPYDEYRVDAGEVDVVYENQGSIVHTLVIRGVDDFKLTVRSKGDVDEGSVELEAGEYELYCDIPGHERAGMEATLVVS